MQYEAFLRVIIILFMAFAVLALGVSTYFMSVTYNEQIVLLHRSIGVMLLILLPMHIYLRRAKLKKMLLDFHLFLFDKKLDESNENEKLIKTLKERSLAEVCQKLNLDIESTLLFLRGQKVDVQNIEDDFKKISEHNSSDTLKIIAMLLEYYIRTPESVIKRKGK